jgi:predicted secreted protein
METRYLLGAAAMAVLAIVAGSFIVYGDSDGQGDDMNVTYFDGPGDVQTAVGEEFVIAMKGNATTGYDWKVASMPEGLELVEDWYQSDSNDNNLCGVGGNHFFKISAEKAGTYDVILDYQRSWEDSPIRTETIKVEVQRSS